MDVDDSEQRGLLSGRPTGRQFERVVSRFTAGVLRMLPDTVL